MSFDECIGNVAWGDDTGKLSFSANCLHVQASCRKASELDGTTAENFGKDLGVSAQSFTYLIISIPQINSSWGYSILQ